MLGFPDLWLHTYSQTLGQSFHKLVIMVELKSRWHPKALPSTTMTYCLYFFLSCITLVGNDSWAWKSRRDYMNLYLKSNMLQLIQVVFGDHG